MCASRVNTSLVQRSKWKSVGGNEVTSVGVNQVRWVGLGAGACVY